MMINAVLPSWVKPWIEHRLPDDVDVRWFDNDEESLALAPSAEIGWFDSFNKPAMACAIEAATQLKWLNSLLAGVDGIPLDLVQRRGIIFTNGAGLVANAVAEYAVMGILTIAKGYREIVRAQDRHEWIRGAPGKIELSGSRALLIGYGAIGKIIERQLDGFGVKVVAVRRSPSPGALTPDEWRDRLGEFDWVILAMPATAETEHMIGEAELLAMKPSAVLVNIARGSVVDQDALVKALRDKVIHAAFLDVTTPEPLPADDPLWSLDNAHITMHLSGQSQNTLFARAADRFLENLQRYRKGEPLQSLVEIDRGY